MIPPLANKVLQDVIITKMDELNLRSIPSFLEKVLQFHETLKVRFGVMLVGPTMSGKSSCLKVMMESYI